MKSVSIMLDATLVEGFKNRWNEDDAPTEIIKSTLLNHERLVELALKEIADKFSEEEILFIADIALLFNVRGMPISPKTMLKEMVNLGIDDGDHEERGISANGIKFKINSLTEFQAFAVIAAIEQCRHVDNFEGMFPEFLKNMFQSRELSI